MRALLAFLISFSFLPCALAQTPSATSNVVSVDVVEGRRVVSVRLPRRASEADLIRTADAIRAAAKDPNMPTLVAFYLPRMPLDLGAWASINFAPGPNVKINGLRLEEQEQFVAAAMADRRALAGVWLTELPAPPGRMIIYRDKGRTFSEWLLRNGRKSVEELSEERSSRGLRFVPKSGGTDFYVLNGAGELELRSAERLIATAERAVLPKPVPMAAGAAPASDGKPLMASEAGAASSALVPVTQAGDPLVPRKKRTVRIAQKAKTAAHKDSFGYRTVFQGSR